jgi:hypothetical protein
MHCSVWGDSAVFHRKKLLFYRAASENTKSRLVKSAKCSKFKAVLMVIGFSAVK